MKNIIETTVRIEGKGDSKEKALNIALGNIQRKIMKDYKENMIIRIEPINVEVIEAKETSHIERFLFFFFPRQRSKYSVVLDVDINLFLLDVEKINFEKNEQGNSLKGQVLGSHFLK
ncbi:DUF4312 family protein [Lysinibacillus sp. NPDC097287]|uniref:DUF4312 family protein n=1 Tax=Lysinibacillus sp. NPDC097287 TaxID=3364144 RepID=UPI00381148C1